MEVQCLIQDYVASNQVKRMLVYKAVELNTLDQIQEVTNTSLNVSPVYVHVCPCRGGGRAPV